MPVDNGVGTSKYTFIKTKLYSALVEKELGMIRGVFHKYKRHNWKRNNVLIIDTTAGPGWNTVRLDGELFSRLLPGSPSIVLDQITRPAWSMLNFHLICIEKNEVSCERLRETRNSYELPDNVTTEIIHADNGVALDEIYKREIKRNDKWQYGWIYNDPTGNVPNFNYMAELSKLKNFKPLDVIINIPTTTILRCLGAPQCKNTMRLQYYLRVLNKSHWWINDTPHCTHKWAMAYGSNNPKCSLGHINVNGKNKFIKTSTDYGECLLYNYSTTKKERKYNNMGVNSIKGLDYGMSNRVGEM